MVWGWLIAGLMTQFLSVAIAEICSSLPTAVHYTCLSIRLRSKGGPYYASAVLAPQGWGPLAAVSSSFR